MPFYSDVLALDPTTFNPSEEEDKLIDETFEELLNSEHLPDKFKNRNKWTKKIIFNSFN